MPKSTLSVAFRMAFRMALSPRCLLLFAMPAAILVAVALTVGASGAQQTSTSQVPDATTFSPLHSRGSHEDDDPSSQLLKEKRARELNVLRQKQLTSDASKLLALATELNTTLDRKSEKSREESTTVELIHKAEQIEKLARSVKSKMTDAASN